MEKNLAEKMGFRSVSFRHWNPHPLVGLSALCFLVPSAVFGAVVSLVARKAPRPYTTPTAIQLVLYSILCVLYTVVAGACALADYFYIRQGHRSTFGKIDIVVASVTFSVSVLSFALRSPQETVVMVAVTVSSFLFSGCSPSYEAWVFRHSLWHLGGSAIATYGSLRLPPASPQIGQDLLVSAAEASAGYLALGTAAVFVFRWLVPTRLQNEIWELGARYAHWKLAQGKDGGSCTFQADCSKTSAMLAS